MQSTIYFCKYHLSTIKLQFWSSTLKVFFCELIKNSQTEIDICRLLLVLEQWTKKNVRISWRKNALYNEALCKHWICIIFVELNLRRQFKRFCQNWFECFSMHQIYLYFSLKRRNFATIQFILCEQLLMHVLNNNKIHEKF